jgi:hypothetical protein
MAAIALAESGGNPRAKNVDANGSVDYGLWQINTVHHYSVADMENPQQNAKEAVSIFNSSGPHAWSSYNNGAYKQFMSGKKAPDISMGIYTPGDYAGTDQGVDFSGAGNIPALGGALITDVGHTTIRQTGNKQWNYVVYLLRDGQYKGHYVYVAENFKPKVHVGQVLQQGDTIGIAPNKYPYTETGFNKSAKGWNAYGNLNGPQPSGKAMKDYIFALMNGSSTNSLPSAGSSGNKSGQITSAITDAVGGWFSGIESLLMQGFFILIGVGLIVVGLGLVAWTVMGKIGAPGVVGMAQSQMRISQASRRIGESNRASTVRESQAGERIQEQRDARALRERSLAVREGNLSRRQEKYVVKDKPNQVVRKKPGNRATGSPRN